MSQADLKIILQDTVAGFPRGRRRALPKEGADSWLPAVPRGPAVLLRADQRLPPAPCRDRARFAVLLGGIVSPNLSDMNGCCLERVVGRQTTVWEQKHDQARGVGTRLQNGSTARTGAQGASRWRKQQALDQAGEMKLHVSNTRVKCAQAACSKASVVICHLRRSKMYLLQT